MTDKKAAKQGQLSEAEISRLVVEAAEQYEEYIRLASLADLAQEDEMIQPRYSWDKPIGLVITKSRPNGKLV